MTQCMQFSQSMDYRSASSMSASERRLKDELNSLNALDTLLNRYTLVVVVVVEDYFYMLVYMHC